MEAKLVKVKRQHQAKSQEQNNSEEVERLFGEHRAEGCEVCMPSMIRRERGHGGVALTSHVHYEDQITPDDRMLFLLYIERFKELSALVFY
jgi:hypothetical protein